MRSDLGAGPLLRLRYGIKPETAEQRRNRLGGSAFFYTAHNEAIIDPELFGIRGGGKAAYATGPCSDSLSLDPHSPAGYAPRAGGRERRAERRDGILSI